MSHEVLAAGREAGPRAHAAGRGGPPTWVVWAVGAVSFVLISLAGLAVASDVVIRTIEADRLLTAVEASEAEMVAVQERVRETLAPLEDGGPLTDEQRERVTRELRQVAEEGEVAIAAAGDRVADLRFVPWHPRLDQARAAYLAHNRAWVDYMAAAAVDPAEFFAPQPAVNDTFAAAKEPLYAALPRFDPLGLVERLAAIYAEDETSDGAGGGQDV